MGLEHSGQGAGGALVRKMRAEQGVLCPMLKCNP